MGKLQSKHACPSSRIATEAECFFVNAHLNKALEAQIWKQKTGCNLANYNMDDTISELSICVADKEGGSPLRVDLPPQKLLDTETSRVLKFDQGEDEEKKENMEEGTVEQKLNIEEFECGVHFEGTESSKQEWSFTLYDFDGHGKITKEDLASLLKALYDAVGSSIKLPHNGTKTLKLRLTVGQDNAQLHSARITSAKSKDSPKVKESKTKEAGKSKDFAKLNNLTTTQQSNVKCNNEKQTAPLANGKTRNQLSVEDQQQLAELVQENMERNHIKQLRRHHSDCRNTEGSHHKRRHRNQLPQIADDKPKESQDRRNYYLDLAGIENNATEFQNTPSMPTAGSGVVHLGNGHHRSRSHDVTTTQKYDNAKRESDRLCKQMDSPKLDHKSRCHELKEETTTGGAGDRRSPKVHKNVTSPQKHGKYRPVSLPAHVPTTVSPHYHRRHRHREKNHDLAMQQVAEWIEREHTWDMDGEKIVIQRHEHHHVHEHHHHHHYHHYYEA